MAGDFLFDEEAQKKPIGVLSGGEKSRLQLAGSLLAKPDILIMDEPTSHLDFETVEALGQALAKFNGAMIFTSHDRTFANLLATGLVEIADGQAKRKFQDYEDYIEDLEQKINQQNWKTDEKTSDSSKQEAYAERKALQKELASIEKKLAKLKTQRAEIIDYFASHPTNYDAERMMILNDLDKSIIETENEWLMKSN
jgi:ATP-binding cassette subfamily F protein 3